MIRWDGRAYRRMTPAEIATLQSLPADVIDRTDLTTREKIAAVGDAEELDCELVGRALQAALDGVVARGKAVVGDKTMVDALTPAVAAAASVNGSVAAVLSAAADAAAEGAESTVPMVARKGRASYLGERSAGHLDPGARSTFLLLRAFADAAAKA